MEIEILNWQNKDLVLDHFEHVMKGFHWPTLHTHIHTRWVYSEFKNCATKCTDCNISISKALNVVGSVSQLFFSYTNPFKATVLRVDQFTTSPSSPLLNHRLIISLIFHFPLNTKQTLPLLFQFSKNAYI